MAQAKQVVIVRGGAAGFVQQVSLGSHKNGIANAGGAKSAWFKDTEGNMLAIVQRLR